MTIDLADPATIAVGGAALLFIALLLGLSAIRHVTAIRRFQRSWGSPLTLHYCTGQIQQQVGERNSDRRSARSLAGTEARHDGLREPARAASM